MAWTASDLTLIETAIRSLITNAVEQVEINGRSYKKINLKELRAMRDEIQTEIAETAYGAAQDVKFAPVTD